MSARRGYGRAEPPWVCWRGGLPSGDGKGPVVTRPDNLVVPVRQPSASPRRPILVPGATARGEFGVPRLVRGRESLLNGSGSAVRRAAGAEGVERWSIAALRW